jgi:hypothetical protein
LLDADTWVHNIGVRGECLQGNAGNIVPMFFSYVFQAEESASPMS